MSEDKPTNRQVSQTSGRRSTRVAVDIPVVIFGQSPEGKVFREQTKTIRVNAHGGLVNLATDVDPRMPVIVVNSKTENQIHCRVAYRAKNGKNQIELGFEFTTPSPKFWGINFPPEDWKPEERKQHTRILSPTAPPLAEKQKKR